MNGETALKFVRSRNSTDPEEGTDFARARRQQKILVALAQKLKQKEVFLNLDRVKELEQLFRTYVTSDLPDEALLALGKIGIGIDVSRVRTIGLDGQNTDGFLFLVNPPIRKYGQWVLEPRTGSWEEIHGYIEKQLKQ
jgi:anionic cell wall polymer biosynthesis LytR-Cps2A-Psr (LCP) family protein